MNEEDIGCGLFIALLVAVITGLMATAYHLGSL